LKPGMFGQGRRQCRKKSCRQIWTQLVRKKNLWVVRKDFRICHSWGSISGVGASRRASPKLQASWIGAWSFKKTLEAPGEQYGSPRIWVWGAISKRRGGGSWNTKKLVRCPGRARTSKIWGKKSWSIAVQSGRHRAGKS